MEKKNMTWAWILGLVVIVIVALLWWHHTTVLDETQSVSYASTSTDDSLISPNVPVTVPVVEENRTSSTVLAIVQSLPNESHFAGLLSSTGASSLLTGKGPYTVFIPTNASFNLLAPGSLNLTAAQLKRLVEYHVVVGRAINMNVAVTGTIQALSRDTLNFSIFPSDKSSRVNSAVALQAYKASNGIVYVISEVLLPPLNMQPE